MTKLYAILSCSVWFVCCSPRAERDDPLELFVEVRDDGRVPVEDAIVFVNGEEISLTDTDGLALLRLSGDEGRRVRIAVTCPSGYLDRSGVEERVVALRRVRPFRAQSWTPMREKFVCQPERSESVLLVRALGGAELDVWAFGKRVGRTDEAGIAHVLLAGHPGEEVEVVLDTSDHPRLMPQSPRRRVIVPPVGQILVFDEQFEEKAPSRRSISRRGGRLPRRL